MHTFITFCGRTAILLALLFSAIAQAEDANGNDGREILRYSRAILVRTVTASSADVPQLKNGIIQSGIFVTLVKNKKVRGCYGSLTPQGSPLAAQLKEYVVGAATQDFRHHPITATELSQIAIIITFIHGVEPVSSISEIDPKTDGLLVRNGDRAAVLLPGEARTASWQVEEAKRQAGIRHGEPAELFKIHTATFYER